MCTAPYDEVLKISNYKFLTWQIDPDNSNPRLDELLFVSLRSLELLRFYKL